MAISRYSGNGIEQTLEKYVPLPFEAMLQAGAAIQQRGDLAQQQIDQVETGLGSIETYAPAQRDFISNYVKDFRSKSTGLLDKYQGNTSDPEFVRESKRLNMQFAGDPRLKIIKETNDKIKFNEQAAGNLQAAGKLFIKPEFTGIDEKGNLTANVGNVQGVNTLDDWTKSGAIAHDSPEEIGTTITNKNNLDRWKKAIANDIQGQQRLTQAYIQQGMSPQEAANAVKSNVQGLINQYGVVSKVNTGLLGLRQSAYQFGVTRQDRKEDQDADRANALAIAQLKASTNKEVMPLLPSFNDFVGRVGSVGVLGIVDEHNPAKNSIMGSGTSLNGTINKKIDNQVISGKIYDITSGSALPKSANVNIENGTLTGYMNVWTIKSDGKLMITGSTTAKPQIVVKNGKTYVTRSGKEEEIVERTVAKYDIFEKEAGKDSTTGVRTVYKVATPKEAMTEMGYSNAFYDGMEPKHGSIKDNAGNVKLDFDYIKEYMTGNPIELENIKQAEIAFNNKTATEDQLEYLDLIENFDPKKRIYDNEIVPSFYNQTKRKNIEND